jgi:twitching motility protein PilU
VLNLAMNIRAILSQRLVKTLDGKRAPAIEILINSPRISDLIKKGDISSIKEAMAEGKTYGMQTFDQHLLQMWRDGVISEDEAMRNADAVNDLRLKIKMAKLEDSGDDSGSSIDKMSGQGESDLKI